MSFFKIAMLILVAFSFINSEEVCGYDQKTYQSVEEAHNAGTKVMTCGPCGKCSNPKDIDIYLKTKENLTQTTRKCGFKATLNNKWGRKCMDKKVGFTPDCMDCWMENIKCDKKNCLSVCMKSALIKEPYVDKHGNLNKCLKCDEEKCGPSFQKCAGSNRRRACISSDIFRDESAICKVCEPQF